MFNLDWITQMSWLQYSPSTYTVYCCYCALFGSQSNCFPSNDWSNIWSNISKVINRHNVNSDHQSAVARGQAFLTVQHDGRPNVSQQLHQQPVKQIERNRLALKSIAEVLIMMGKQNIPIRGHVPEESNFQAILSVTAQQNSILRNHLEQAGPTAKYTSPKIHNEVLDIATSQILNAVVSNCKRAQCAMHLLLKSPHMLE